MAGYVAVDTHIFLTSLGPDTIGVSYMTFVEVLQGIGAISLITWMVKELIKMVYTNI